MAVLANEFNIVQLRFRLKRTSCVPLKVFGMVEQAATCLARTDGKTFLCTNWESPMRCLLPGSELVRINNLEPFEVRG